MVRKLVSQGDMPVSGDISEDQDQFSGMAIAEVDVVM